MAVYELCVSPGDCVWFHANNLCPLNNFKEEDIVNQDFIVCPDGIIRRCIDVFGKDYCIYVNKDGDYTLFIKNKDIDISKYGAFLFCNEIKYEHFRIKHLFGKKRLPIYVYMVFLGSSSKIENKQEE